MITILLVEDEPMWQQAIQSMVSTDPSFAVVGVADHYEMALALYDQWKPQVVLLDWKILGSRDGLAVADALIQKGHPQSQMVLVSGSDPEDIPDHGLHHIPKLAIASQLVPYLRGLALPSASGLPVENL